MAVEEAKNFNKKGAVAIFVLLQPLLFMLYH
jgi:hypothetical protein